ncbi:MAG: TIGR00730 family Rossman fold protein [Candidatus Methanomethylicota archaeon]|uniref:TIGR00730 family Rossman fold protein n=1 Tax=Thermoproteota archaeon TaxID=2056631 RepID=A0A497EY19_9CREN|nr:MAG: TIGR00730 family Rossman fold protein [Candidatus Verstraetearchaeota archaeon]
MSTSKEKSNVGSIMTEFAEADHLFEGLGKAVTIFGSARTPRTAVPYQKAADISEKLAKNGFSTITGGGMGIMAAGNEGAYRVQNKEVESVGMGIVLPFETENNQYVTKCYTYKYFFVRKVMMVKYSDAFICMEGGFGTLDEMFEVLTLIQTLKTRRAKVYLVGVDYYTGLLDWIKTTMLGFGYISPEDIDLIHLTDDVDEVVRMISDEHANNQRLDEKIALGRQLFDRTTERRPTRIRM